MSIITKPYTAVSGATITHTDYNNNYDTIYNDYNGNITNANISASAAISDTKLDTISSSGKVNFSALTITGETQGDIIYRNGSTWTRLAAGTSGQILQTQGAGANPQWAGSSGAKDGITRGFEIEYKNSTSINVLPGTLYHNVTQVNLTAKFPLSVNTASHYWDSVASHSFAYAGGISMNYVGVDSSGDIRLLFTNAPDVADAAGNSVGTLLYFDDTAGTSGEYWRIIGAFPCNRSGAQNALAREFYQEGNRVFYTDYADQNLVNNGASQTWATLNCASYVPSFAYTGYFYAETNATADANFRPDGVSSTNGLIRVNADTEYDAFYLNVSHQASNKQKIQYKNSAGGGATDVGVIGYDISTIKP